MKLVPRLAASYRAARRNFWRSMASASGWSWRRFLAQLVGSGWPRRNKQPAVRRGRYPNRRAERVHPHAVRRMIARRAVA